MLAHKRSNCSFCMALTILVLFAPGARGATGEVEDIVKELGRSENSIDKVKELSQHSEQAIPLLIEELRPLKEARILSEENKPEAEHVLWCIRALRFLTGGVDFCATTTHRFAENDIEKNRKYWLQFRHGKCLTFFALWPSRVSTYIAPLDVQEKIIGKWKAWYKGEAKPPYKPLKDPKPEEWLW